MNGNKAETTQLISSTARLLGLRHQRQTANLPVERMLLGLHQNSEDEVPIVALRILVDRAVVRTVLAVVQTLRATRGERGTCEVDHRHWQEELLRLTLVELPLLAVPLATLDEETVDILTLFWHVLHTVKIEW